MTFANSRFPGMKKQVRECIPYLRHPARKWSGSILGHKTHKHIYLLTYLLSLDPHWELHLWFYVNMKNINHSKVNMPDKLLYCYHHCVKHMEELHRTEYSTLHGSHFIDCSVYHLSINFLFNDNNCPSDDGLHNERRSDTCLAVCRWLQQLITHMSQTHISHYQFTPTNMFSFQWQHTRQPLQQLI